MKLLVPGGTIFLGRHGVAAALARGHAVTLFKRGRHGGTLFPQVERLVADRDGDVGALAGRRFDATIDCSGHTPAQVERSNAAPGDGAGHAVFVSTVSVHAGFAPDKVHDEPDAYDRAAARPVATLAPGREAECLATLQP